MAISKSPKSTSAKTTKAPKNEIVAWDEELAKQAEVASAMEAATGGTGQFFGLKSGILTWQDAPVVGNQMAVIILDAIMETVYYEGAYDPDTPQSPTAFAFGRDEKTMVWHENSDPEFAGKLCSESDVCQWGSADTGKGKAARETRRLALIPAGNFTKSGDLDLYEDPDHFQKAAIGFMRLPVTSVKGYASFVKQVAAALRRPPHGILTHISVVPDPKTQFRVLFEAIEPVDNSLMPIIMKRHEEAKLTIDFPYTPVEEAALPQKSRGKAAPAAKARGRKY